MPCHISRLLLLLALPGLAVDAQLSPSAKSEVAGTWEGESICTVPASPCHDEHVIYEFSTVTDAPVKAGQTNWKLDGHKIVAGEKQFMGTLQCTYRTAKKSLRCSSGDPNHDDWLFTIEGQTMQGTLRIEGGKTLYRKINVHRK